MELSSIYQFDVNRGELQSSQSVAVHNWAFEPFLISSVEVEVVRTPGSNCTGLISESFTLSFGYTESSGHVSPLVVDIAKGANFDTERDRCPAACSNLQGKFVVPIMLFEVPLFHVLFPR